MESWAQKRPNVQYLCVCVDSQGVAFQFQQMFGFQHAKNCWIPDRRYFPVGYGQLGCSGFVISDEDGLFVSRKTTSYLNYGEKAFDDVDDILDKLLEKKKDNKENYSPTSSVTPLKTENREEKAPKRQKKEEEEKKMEIEVPKSVGVDSMDEDHEECAVAIALLIKTRSVDALQTVSQQLIHHFNEEEELMQKHNFGNANDDPSNEFSAYRNHVKDHKRILEIINREINAVALVSSACCGAKGTSTCETTKKLAKVDTQVIKEIVEAFSNHTEKYDSLYGHVIPSNAS